MSIMDMFAMLSDQEQQERIAVCDACEHKIKITNLCGKCGCFIPAKVALASANCPELKWPTINNNLG